jgi:hypothetical protein
MIVVLLIIFIVGALLVVLGLKHNAVRLPEQCGRCGFDLSGLATGPTRAVTRCPECGADLSLGHTVPARAVVKLRLTPAGGMGYVLLATATLMLLVHLALLAIGRADDLTPQWRLEQRAMRNDERALRELTQRIAARQVDPARATRLVEAGLDAQERIAERGFIHGPAQLAFSEEPPPPDMYWPELLIASLRGDSTSAEQAARIVERGLLVSVYPGENGSLYVQVLCLLGPGAAGLVDVTVEESMLGASPRREARWPGVHGWSWKIDRPVEVDDAAHIHWRIDADRALAALGVSSTPGPVSGEARVAWPEMTRYGDGRSPLLRRWWLGEPR